MTHDASPPIRDATERQLMHYLWALDRADFDSVANVLARAAVDLDLDRLIVEVNRVLHDEQRLSPLAADTEVIKALLQRFLPSGIPSETEEIPVSVGEIAAKLAQDRHLSAPDRGLGRRLAQSEVVVPAALNRESVRRLAAVIGGEGSDAFWRRFRDLAIMAWMGRGHQQIQLAASRRARGRPSAQWTPESIQVDLPTSAGPLSPSVMNPLAAARRAYADAGRNIDLAETVVAPLDEILGAYPIRVAEVPQRTYQRAAEFLAAETGQLISVAKQQTGTLAGFLFCLIENDTLLGCILLNQRDRIERRRFSAAHELGHYLMHFLPLLGRNRPESGVTMLWEGLTYGADGDDTDTPSGTMAGAQAVPAIGPDSVLLGGEWREEAANQFAAELLMPAASCGAAVERHRQRFGGVVHVRLLASEFLVSQTAMRRRLHDLGLGDEDGDGRMG
jgi:hypothetical protein